MKKILSITLVIILLTTLSGCLDLQLKTDKFILPGQVRSQTGARLIKTEKETDSYERPTQTYYFEGRDFTFEVQEYYCTPTFFPIHSLSTTYYHEMLRYNQEAVSDILAKYGFTNVSYEETSRHHINRQQQALDNNHYVEFNFEATKEEYSTSSLSITFLVTEHTGKDVEACAQEIKNALWDYHITNPKAPFDTGWRVDMYIVTEEGGKPNSVYKEIENSVFYDTTDKGDS